MVSGKIEQLKIVQVKGKNERKIQLKKVHLHYIVL